MEISKDEMVSMSFQSIAERLGSDLKNGLASSEAQSRISRYGYNEIEGEKKNPLISLGKKFWNASAWILEFAAFLTFILGKLLDFYIIVALIVFNAILSFSQEMKANEALEALKNRLQVRARVLRSGEWSTIEARLLVPGDIIRVRAGDFVPADMKIIDGDVEIDQSALTGESLTVTRKKDDPAYSGSILKRGECSGIVVFTGKNTYFGKTAELVRIAHPRLRIEHVISRVVAWMILLVAILLAVAVASFILRHENVITLVPLMLVLVVGSIPIALPAMFSISLALGAEQLSRSEVLVTRLDSIEGAATMDVLASDKTGTITINKLSISEIVPFGCSENEAMLYGALASDSANQDPIDTAFLEETGKRGIDLSKFSITRFIPFDPATRRTEAEVSSENDEIAVAKGAVETIAQMCGKFDRTLLDEEIKKASVSGSRVIAVAARKRNGRWEMKGLIAMSDPPRSDSAQMISELKDLGVKVKMLTGDAVPVAHTIAETVGIGRNIISVRQLKENREGMADLAWSSDGFAEVYPEDKYLIVGALQKAGHIVGMTGDGVNDAPALRQADVGIAVSSATDVAKGAAGVVLVSPGLKNAVSLVRIGRQIYERVNTWTLSRLTRTFQNVVFVTIALLLTGLQVLSTFDMVLLLFLFDFVTLTLSTDNVVWPRKPARWNMFDLAEASSIIGTVMVIESFFALYFILRSGLAIAGIQTLVFDYLLYSNIFNLINIRERRNFWSSRPSSVMSAAITADIVISAVMSVTGIPGLHSAPFDYVVLTFLLALLFNLGINNFVKLLSLKYLRLSW
ncbi:MAG: plasma-membrane proton-efflux P-type ATPase [Thermoplasmata archaeon]|uniref:Plasma-membrane proton-efflux P-type ATPase n=1 Tax=Candidatus Sysuiplasma superficiale TaxID=2823368 RepID=A0A8J7YSK8_9ARCH|nr:plasma-membrane proton-efflux P-type ATPase [Candidatus Sysuiplasma superficiale]